MGCEGTFWVFLRLKLPVVFRTNDHRALLNYTSHIRNTVACDACPVYVYKMLEII